MFYKDSPTLLYLYREEKNKRCTINLKKAIEKVLPKNTVWLYYDPDYEFISWEEDDKTIPVFKNNPYLEMRDALLNDFYYLQIGKVYIFWNRYTHSYLHQTNIRNWFTLLVKKI
jgi:hypothetical protein